MSNLGGKKMSEDTDRDNNPTGTVTSVSAGTNITITGTADDPIVNSSASGGENTTKGDVEGYDTGAARIPVGSDDQVLTADSTADLGVAWKNAAAGDPLTTKGDIMAFDTDADRVPVGTDDQVLTADSTNAFGLAWKDAAAGGGTSVLSLGDSARITRTTNLTMDGNQVIVFTLEDYDDGDFANVPSVNDRFTIPAGVTRVDIGFHCQTSGISVSNYLKLSIDHLDSGLSTIELFSMHESDTGSTTPGYDCSLPGLDVTPGDVIRFRMLCEDTSYTITKASAFIRDVTPGGATATALPSGCRVTRTTDKTGLGTTLTALTWDSEIYDDDNWHPASDNSRLTVPTGVTRVDVSCSLFFKDVTAGADIYIYLQQFDNGTDNNLLATVAWQHSDAITTASGLSAAAIGVNAVAGNYFVVKVKSSDSSYSIDLTSTMSIKAVNTPVIRAVAAGPQGARIERVTNLILGTASVVNFVIENYDDAGFADLGADADRFTIPTGVTRVNITGHIQATGVTVDDQINLSIVHYNSGDTILAIVAANNYDSSDGTPGMTCSAIGVPCVATDYFRLLAGGDDSSWTITDTTFAIQDMTP